MVDFQVREAREEDIPGVQEVFYKCYGVDYPYRDFYDDQWLKRALYSDNYLFLVAAAGQRILGTGAIYFEAGVCDDLIGEFGRLAVDPEMRGIGVGGALLEERLRFARQRLHFGYAQARTVHPFAQRIAYKYGLKPIGFLPLKSLFSRRENLAVMAQLFRSAPQLRRSNPRIIPEMLSLAASALRNLGLPNDLTVVEDVSSYPMRDAYVVEDLTEEGIPYLLRIERGRLKRRQIFGNLMLSYGYFALQARKARYLIAKQDDVIVGAIGFVYDPVGKTIKIFELVDLDDAVGGFLLWELDRRVRQRLDVTYSDVVYMEVTVSAYWPEMQRTLDQLGFCPVCYCPSYVFRGVERMDAIRMAKVYVPFELGQVEVIPPVQEVYQAVVRGFLEKRVGGQIGEMARSVAIFCGLSDDQISKIASACELRYYNAGQTIFRYGEMDANLYIVLSGEINIIISPEEVVVGQVRAGDILGEVALLESAPHSATATTTGKSQLIVLTRQNFEALMQRNPRIGMIVMRNIARSLGGKLQAADRAVSRPPAG